MSASQQVTLPGFLQSLGPVISRHGYFAVAGFVFLEDFGVPVPGETILIAAAIFAGAGRLSIVGVAVIAFAAAVLGDNVGFAIGRFGGRVLVERFGRYVFITKERLAHAEAFFERQGPKIIVVARFIEGLRQANGIIAGISEMRWLRFLAYNALGAAIWVGLWTTVGDLAGAHIGTIYSDVTHYFLVALAVVVVALVVLVLRHRHRRAHRARSEETKAAPGATKAGPNQ